MNTWTAENTDGKLAGTAPPAWPARAAAAAASRVKTGWPRVRRAAGLAQDAVVAVFIAVGCVLGFGVYCIKGIVFGFCLAAGIPQPAELIARRRAARKPAPGPQPGP